ncbi:MAG TPA: T9SS type A sorting domain-containing protein, partial [Bacteroidia bacterium]|nr:T9SS type A sorting domain-containing protein [Bacteroidia bacterium]
FHNTEVWGVASDYFPCHNCTIPHIGLPIQLMSFTASNTGDAVQLQWATGSETDNNYFTLGRSTDGVNYTTIVTVKGAGNATTEHTYSYTDISAPAGTDYYRLQQTDYDGTITTVGTTVATIAATATTQATVFPNPVRNMCIVSFTDALQENIQVTVYDCTGREAATMNTQTNKGKNAIELNTSALAAGIYFVTIPVSGSTLKARFVK